MYEDEEAYMSYNTLSTTASPDALSVKAARLVSRKILPARRKPAENPTDPKRFRLMTIYRMLGYCPPETGTVAHETEPDTR